MKARWGVVALFLLGAIAARMADVPALAGKHKGDEATFVLMTLSLVHDGDLEYRQEDYTRFVATMGHKPDGLFVKRGWVVAPHLSLSWPFLQWSRTPLPSTEGLEYGKAFLFAVVAAPFVWALGLGGFWFLNVVLLVGFTACAVAFARARIGHTAGTVFGVAFVWTTIAPVYLVWLTPEILNLACVGIGYFLWLYKLVATEAAPLWRGRWTDAAAALLIGLATFSKPPNAPLIAPLVCWWLWQRDWKPLALGLCLFTLGSAGNFGINALITGELNYQGGDRRTYYADFPFEAPQHQFETAGNTMVTAETNDDGRLEETHVWPLLVENVPDFFLGQSAGFLPYFFPAALIGGLFLWRWRQASLWQWLVFLAVTGIAAILLVLAPYSWSGGGGPVGNRYYLSIYPAWLFLLPAGVGLGTSLVAGVVGLVALGPALVSPMAASREPWTIGDRWPLRVLRAELAVLDDSPVRLSMSRGRIPYHIEEFVYLYYLDAHSYSPEPAGGVPGAPTDGLWIAGGTTARIVVRSGQQPLSRLELTVSSRLPNRFSFEINGDGTQVELAPEQRAVMQITPSASFHHPERGYYYVLEMRTDAGFVPAETDAASKDTRNLGVFVKPVFRTQSYGRR